MTAANRLPGDSERPEALQDFASRHIVRAIVTGGLQPGAKLSPIKLAEELNISHIPVREALAALEASGHVVREPRRGFFVAELSLGYIEDVYHWREVLENEAHRIAVPKLDKADLTRMRKINREVARTTLYSVRYIDLNRDLHFVAFERAGSENLLRFLNHLWDASMRYQSAMTAAPQPKAQIDEQHGNLLDAFAARDVDRVNHIMAEHRGITLNALRRMLTPSDEVGA
jgi:DNA-binding GntR family transcriptional regulator